MSLKGKLGPALRFILPLALGVFLIYYIYQGFSAGEKEEIGNALRQADYSWILLSFFIGLLSHFSRALRWLQLIETMHPRPSPVKSFYSVMIGYLANMAFPRLGEVSRCGGMSKSTGIPFQNLFGTVLAERMIDLLMLLSITFCAFWSESEVLGGFVNEKILLPIREKFFSGISGVLWLGILTTVLALAFLLLRSFLPAFLLRIRNFFNGFSQGFQSVLKVRNRWLFIFHTFFIWGMYFLMYRVCFYSIEGVSDVMLPAVLASFVMGSFGIIFTQGGIGAYHGLVAATLLLYGVDFALGYAFAWIAWAGQTAMILLAGFFSLIALPLTSHASPANARTHEQVPAGDP